MSVRGLYHVFSYRLAIGLLALTAAWTIFFAGLSLMTVTFVAFAHLAALSSTLERFWDLRPLGCCVLACLGVHVTCWGLARPERLARNMRPKAAVIQLDPLNPMASWVIKTGAHYGIRRITLFRSNDAMLASQALSTWRGHALVLNAPQLAVHSRQGVRWIQCRLLSSTISKDSYGNAFWLVTTRAFEPIFYLMAHCKMVTHCAQCRAQRPVFIALSYAIFATILRVMLTPFACVYWLANRLYTGFVPWAIASALRRADSFATQHTSLDAGLSVLANPLNGGNTPHEPGVEYRIANLKSEFKHGYTQRARSTAPESNLSSAR